jgi:diacylglycerol kinase family enzyme
MKHLFIVNPRSFLGKYSMEPIIAGIREVFQMRESDCVIHISRFSRDAIAVIRNYVRDAPDEEIVRVYAVGGDGILFDCLNGVVGLPNAELAIVPYGRSNDTVRAFGDDVFEQFRNIGLQAVSPAIPTDIIYCGTNYALNFCSVGLETDAIMKTNNINQHFENSSGWLRRLNHYMYPFLLYIGAIQAAFNKIVVNQYYNVTIDGEDFSGCYGGINIANGPCYGGDKCPVITAMPNDGFLDALFLMHKNPLRTLRKMVPYTMGKYAKYPNDLIWKRMRKVTINSELPLFIDLDGETFFDNNITVEVIPGAVKIVAVNGLDYLKRAEPIPTGGANE